MQFDVALNLPIEDSFKEWLNQYSDGVEIGNYEELSLKEADKNDVNGNLLIYL